LSAATTRKNGTLATRLTGAKSRTGSIMPLRYSAGLTPSVVLVAISSVVPSAELRATVCAPSIVPTPGLLSTTIGWPSALANGSAIDRARVSVNPPGG
jgi:hypothetical protein